MSKKHNHYTLLGVLALAMACVVCSLAKPKADAGWLELRAFNYLDEQKRAVFIYHPPQGRKGYWSIKYRCLDLRTGKELSKSDTGGFLAPGYDCYVLDCPTNSIWRLKAEVATAAKGLPAFFTRVENMCREKSLTAWHNVPYRYFATVYSCPITNSLPRTASP